ncbi:hypothetical protein PPL_00173 [Heterostelium album PN500]|uniref:NAD(P)-binding protein n=1 Tax=Heterostelium pallidum (strain ATCC 26659 / Pp 5 / PN500) TaxID=670386 RepID=D3AVQ8_HETP5|nr:hypothetical protein PPL_00173 [Heterostelium album PN500]EFA86381.1 hypothetical protein PPL_00173 [Heterostelium album PN500]|eukprot:XP_020438486.1 hypothetical protein PPL_00173 [Heterostelium album PN500]
METIKQFFVDQYAKLHFNPVDLKGKVIIVTGSNIGIGFATVQHLLKMNPDRIVMACRNMEKAKEAISKLQNDNGVAIEAWQLDISSFESIKSFVKRYQDSSLPLHILINNAGLGGNMPFSLTKDGHETMYATNHLGTTLLTLLLLPVIRKTALENNVYPRIINLASEVHLWTNFSVKDKPNIIKAMDDPNLIVGFDRYSISKLMNVMFTKSLAKHLQDSNQAEDKKISVYSINPGMVTSDLGLKDDKSWLSKLAFKTLNTVLSYIIARTPEEGSKTTILAATSVDYGVESGIENGIYFSSCKPAKVNSLLDGEEGQALLERLWKETLQVLPVEVQDVNI